MNQIVVLIFPDQAKIDKAIRTLRKLHSERSIKLYASAVVAKNRNGYQVQFRTGTQREARRYSRLAINCLALGDAAIAERLIVRR